MASEGLTIGRLPMPVRAPAGVSSDSPWSNAGISRSRSSNAVSNLTCRRHKVDQRRPYLVPTPSLETAIRVDPESLGRHDLKRRIEQLHHLGGLGHTRRVNVPDARADLIGVVEAGEGRQEIHLRSRRFDRYHVGIKGSNRL